MEMESFAAEQTRNFTEEEKAIIDEAVTAVETVCRERIISNPDVEHHNAWAAFDIGGETKNCVVVFTTKKPFEKPGDSFFHEGVTGLVPVDDLAVMYMSDEASNFWDVFGRNTDYVIDPEETLADNFSFTIIYGVDSEEYPNPEIIEAIDALLRAGK